MRKFSEILHNTLYKTLQTQTHIYENFTRFVFLNSFYNMNFVDVIILTKKNRLMFQVKKGFIHVGGCLVMVIVKSDIMTPIFKTFYTLVVSISLCSILTIVSHKMS